MADDKQPNVKPVTPDTTDPNHADADGRVTRPRQATDKVATEAEKIAELGDELGGPA